MLVPLKFRKKKTMFVDADTAIRNIKKGKRILIGSGSAAPQHLIQSLIRNAHYFRNNEIVHLLTLGVAPYADPVYAHAFRHNAFFIGSNVRQAVVEGRADYIPIFLSEVPALFRTGQMPIHCALIQVSPPDEKNQVSLGTCVDILPSGVAQASIVIAQINKNMPTTYGKSKIPFSAIDYVVNADEPLLELKPKPIDEVSQKISEHLAPYIQDGDTLQLGIGTVPDAVAKLLLGKHDLGIHSEMVSDGIIDLYKNGNITNKRKGIHKGKSIVSFALGSQKLYQMIGENPDFHLYPTEYVNDPFVIAQNKNMVSINSTIQIDLTGQVCSDSIGSRFFSGFGGQVDFVRGARRSPGGRSFITLPSTAKDGSISRIVPHLSEGAGVVTSRADVHYIVTEYGVAYLHGRNIRQRALALIQIAHPKFRDELLSKLKEKHYVFFDSQTIKDDESPAKQLIPYSMTFKNNVEVFFRPLRPSDEESIQDFFYSHNPETIYQRYLSYVDAMPHNVASARVSVDYNQDMAIAGFDSPQPYAHMVSLGRYIRGKDNYAEVGLVVKENYQALGIGTFILSCLIKAARRHAIKRLIANVSRTNHAMLSIFKKNGFNLAESKTIDGFYVYLDIEPVAEDLTKIIQSTEN